MNARHVNLGHRMEGSRRFPPPWRVTCAIGHSAGFSDRAAEWSRRFHRIAPNRRRIVVVRPAARTRVGCDRGRARMPRSTGGAFFRRCRHRWRRPEDTERRDAEHKMRLHQPLPNALRDLSPLPLGAVSRPAQCVACRSALTQTIGGARLPELPGRVSVRIEFPWPTNQLDCPPSRLQCAQ